MANETDICRNETDNKIMGNYPGQSGGSKIIKTLTRLTRDVWKVWVLSVGHRCCVCWPQLPGITHLAISVLH